MPDPFSSFARGLKSGREMKDQRAKSAMDALLQQAQLSELGYEVQQSPRRGLFGGGQQTLTRRPDYVSTKDLERQKLQKEVEAYDLPAPAGYQRFGNQLLADKDYISPRDKASIDYMKMRSGSGDNLTPGQRTAKDKATADIFETVEANKVKRFGISEAKDAMKRVPQGAVGAARFAWNKHFDPNDPMLGDFQKIRMIGTDAQLMNTAKTKGAISDKEMALFATAAANDDFISVERLKPVLDKLERFIAAEEAGKFGAYQQSYKEDPRQWFGQPQPEQGGEVPEWASSDPSAYEDAKNNGFQEQEIMDWFSRNGLLKP